MSRTQSKNDITIILSYKKSQSLVKRTMESIASQTYKDIRLLLVQSSQLERYTLDDNDVFVIQENSITEALNKALSTIQTEYVMFMNEGDELQQNDFITSQIHVINNTTKQDLKTSDHKKNTNKNYSYTLENEIATDEHRKLVFPKNFCISPLLKKQPVEHRFSSEFINGVYAIDIRKNYFALQTALSGCLISSDMLKDYRFLENVKFEYEVDCILRLLLKAKVYLVNDKAQYKYMEPLENQVLYHLPAHDIEWYHASITNFVNPLIAFAKAENTYLPFIQNYLVYYIRCRFLANLDNRNKKQINHENLDSYVALLKGLLSEIDDAYILNKDMLIYLSRNPELNSAFLNLKYGEGKVAYEYNDTVDEEGNPDIEMSCHGHVITKLSNHRFTINLMNYYDGKLSIDGSLISVFRYSNLEFFAQFEGSAVKIEDTDAYSLTKYFGVPVYRRITYHLEFPLDDDKKLQKISFFAKLNGKKYPMKISFGNHWAKLSKSPKYSYWRFHNYFCHHGNNMILIKKARKLNVLKREIQLQLNMIKIFNKNSLSALTMRWLYWITHPYFKNKKIWLMLDKLYKGGDSSEYLYRYAYPKTDGIHKYYLINKNTKEFAELKKDGFKPVVNGSLKHKLIFLNADLILITNSHLFPFNGYSKATSKYIRGLCNFSSMCLQHGLTVQKCAMAQRRIIDNTTGYFLASKFEYENLMHHAYSYAGFPYLHITGIARYDGLINNDKKQILLSPTWRMYNALPVTKSEGEQRGYNPDFKHTTYFHVYNRLLNNEKLIACAKATGYKIKFLLHPILSSQVNDFTPNSELEVIPSVGSLNYEKILTESSLMVTDYSGVQFDFAYMRKPVVYFHPEELPPHYENGIFFYDSMGFGEICTKLDELVGLLCEYMQHDCKMKEQYQKRANDFFVYDDHNNCKRIYDEIYQYQKKIDIDKLRSSK